MHFEWDATDGWPLLHCAHDTAMNPFGLLDTGLAHLHAEIFTVEAVDEDGALDAVWDAFDEDRYVVDYDTDVHVSVAP